MTISSTGATTSAGNLQAAGLGMNDFLKILLTQLTYQDPLKPMDNQEFIAQMAQFTALDGTRQLNEKISQLLTIQSATQSIGLLGKSVDVTLPGGAKTGQVASLSFASGEPQMTVKTASGELLTGVSFSQIRSIR
ncbi:flagellar hook assembly protein FlgD [Parachitinimonas caeni]|uniref:Basal-body rod modification protein FlgD n=1 Tax=Parachitinimonas caeni TaxID=3031301 RepID=A0ABT7DYP6_9NEIS|nr:flagellar hook capping FlgD N-terminal domain-containing protein [Parachitinimonas caeni]MDK2125129.1 flagellar hook capping FlgD N-terminal domain-containing protein [Parachitinimonas caeni]